VETISSGSLGIDLALELVVTQEEELLKYGPESSGKTTLTLHAIEAQKPADCCLLMRSTHSTEIMLKN
jgi:RecA/RadA recombinase